MSLYVVGDSTTHSDSAINGDSLNLSTDSLVETAPVLKWRLKPKKRYDIDLSGNRTGSVVLGSVPSLTDCCLRKIDANLENYSIDDFRAQINPVQANWVIKWVTKARNDTLSTPIWWIAARICGKENVKEPDSAHFVSLLPTEILHHLSTHLALKEMQIPRSADFSVITTLSLSSLTRKDISRVPELRHLPYLTFLILNDSQLTDDSLRHLAMGLQLQGPPTDWKGMWRLRGIWLDGTKGISDKSIKSLWKFPMLNVISLSGTSVTDAGHKVLQAISAETNNRYLKATRLHTELALAERPTTTVRKGAVQDRIYKGYHRLWPEAVGWEGSPEFPSYRVHVIGDPAAVKPVMRTKANGVQRESGPVMGIDAVPAAPQLFPLISQCPIYSAPGFTVVDSSTFQHSNERSKRFVSTGAPPSRRKRRAVTDDKPPQGVARQTVLSGMLIRDAIDEKQLSADTVRKNLMATIINEKKVKAKLAAAATAAAPSVPPKVGGFFSASRSAQSQEVDISKSHLPATKAGHLDRRYGNRAQYLAKPAMTSALSGCPSLISSQSTMSTSAQTSPTTQSQELYVSSTPITSSIPSTPCKTGPSKPLGRLASASLSLDPVEARPSKKATGYGMFRKK